MDEGVRADCRDGSRSSSRRLVLGDVLDSVLDFVIGQTACDVGLGLYADEVMPVDDREAAELVLFHGGQGLVNVIVRPDGDGFALG